MLYQIKNGTVSLGGKTILSHIDFYIKEKEKLAIVGRNGIGKTTLLRLIAGELDLDRDDVALGSGNGGIFTSRKLSVGMLRQADIENQDKTLEEIILQGCIHTDKYSRERFEYEMEFDRIFTGFGFEKEEKKKRLREFSGGEQTKISLINLLLQKPDILLLDEPTNHLDIASVQWLEEYMRDYPNAVIFVSHDRYFLDQTVDSIYEMEDCGLKRYAGNYTDFRKQKTRDMRIARKAYDRQQEEIAHLEDLIERFKHKPSKAKFARAKRSELNRIKRIEKPQEDTSHIFTGDITPEVLGSKCVYECKHLKIGYDGKSIQELSLRIRRGQKLAVIGDNGIGKSTFLKTVAGYLEAVDGEGSLGNNILMGYFDQMSASITDEKSVVEHFHSLFPAMTEKEVRSTLGAYLFSGKNASVPVKDLSGGQKARLVLAELITSKPNFMVLDEPTNHMDIQAKETLESAFKAYKGTMLFVSHDRYFINEVADSLLIFEKDSVMYYPFSYEHYISRLRNANRDELAALIQAQDQALIDGLKAVPKPKRPEYRPMTTEEAYLDWKLNLEAEPMNEAAEAAGMAFENRYETEDGFEKMDSAMAAWTEECIKWYDKYIEIKYGGENYD